jgi:Fibronectin type III-like domain
VSPDGSITATMDVTNTGDRRGDEVVQLYIHDPVASISQPVRRLRGFERVTLDPGEQRTVTFTLDSDFGFYDNRGRFVVEPGPIDVYAGNSSAAQMTRVVHRDRLASAIGRYESVLAEISPLQPVPPTGYNTLSGSCTKGRAPACSAVEHGRRTSRNPQDPEQRIRGLQREYLAAAIRGARLPCAGLPMSARAALGVSLGGSSGTTAMTVSSW